MSSTESEKYSRQEGLVHQPRVEKLRIGLKGTNPLLEEQLILISEHLGIKEFPVTNDMDMEIVIDSNEKNEEKSLYINMKETGFNLNTEFIDVETSKTLALLAPGLSTLAAAMTWQEILQRNNCIRKIPIMKKYATVQFRVNTQFTNISDNELSGIQAFYGGQRLALFSEPCNDGTGHIRLTARLDLDTSIIKDVLQNVDLEIDESSDIEEPYSFEFTIPPIEKLPEGNLVVAGVGGLGTWSLYTLFRGVLNAGGSGQGLNITIFDPDESIEIHNLNRQVLYDESHIDRPKADCAAEILTSNLSNLNMQFGVQALGLPELDILLNQDELETYFDDDDIDLLEELELSENKSLSANEVKIVLKESNLILCGVDNLHARGVLSGITSHLNIPFINAGAENFSGQFDVFLEPGCMACRYGPDSVRDKRITSCQEDGDIPVASIVTTTAIFGALEGLSTLTALSDISALGHWPTQAIWGGRSNRLRSLRPPRFLQGDDHVEHIIQALGSVKSNLVKVDKDTRQQSDNMNGASEKKSKHQ
jgi:molybdopterin/thiamine biosynthesis adenylyltransferase